MPDLHALSLTDQVTDTLLRRLANNEWPVRARLPGQNELAKQMSVSVVVVREALARLKAEGLVEPRQGAGVFVVALPGTARAFKVAALAEGDRKRLTDVFEVRITIEVAAAQMAAQRRLGPDVLACTEAFKQLKAALAAGEDAVAEDFEFHLSIAKASHNEFYPELLRYLHQVLIAAIRTARTQTRSMPGRLRTVQDEHASILQAIVEGNATAAAREMRLHLTHATERLALASPRSAATEKADGHSTA
jgi:DNA-binding FadR family transcriptional regulator